MHTVLITGATDGLGLALARRYRAQGSVVLMVGRRSLAALEPAFFTPATYCEADLALPDAHRRVAAWLDAQAVRALDLLIHNAGLGYVGDLESQDPANIRTLVDVNLWAPIALSHALFPRLQAAQARCVFISSVAADLPGPRYAVYTATKAALDGFARAWRAELRADGSGVTVQVIHPGAVRTAMHAKSGADPAALGWERFPPPDEVAAAIEAAILRSPRDATIGAANRFVRSAGRRTPGVVDRLAALRRAPALVLPPPDSLPHVLITGAADGIGRALALHFAADGYLVSGVDRDAARAIQTQGEILNRGGRARFVTADLGANSGVEEVVRAAAAWPPVDVLIHNAGINCVGPFVASDLARQRAVVEVNFMAPLLLTAGLLRERGLAAGGMLVAISSLSRFVGYPGAAVYAATKDGLAAYARSVRVALAGAGVGALIVYPGPTRTAHARQYSPDNRREQRRMPPETLAALIYTGVQQRRRELIPGAANQFAAGLGRLAPGLMAGIMRRTLYAPLARTR